MFSIYGPSTLLLCLICLRPRFDFLTVSAIANLIYFFPLLFGKDGWQQDINIEIYVTYLIVSLSHVLYLVFLKPTLPRPSLDIKTDYISSMLYFSKTISVINFIFIALFYGISEIFANKVGSNIAFANILLWRVATTFYLCSAIILTRKFDIFLAFILLLFLFFTGDRTGIVLSMLAGLIAFSSYLQKNKYWFLNIVFILPSILIGILGIFGKEIYSAITSQVISESLIDIDLMRMIMSTEPFFIQLIFNEVINFEYRVSSWYLLLLPLSILPLGLIGFSSNYFNTEFQNSLFPWMKEGTMAYNYWAEGYANFGFSGIILFIIIYFFILFFIEREYQKGNILSILMLILGTYLAFYIQRNSIFSIISYLKHFIYFFLGYIAIKELLTKKNA